MADYLLIQALNGLVIGIIYAVIAAGLTVIFSILKIVNFAHGEVFMMGGYFAYFAITLAGIPPLGGVVVAMALSFLLSVLIERTLLTPLYSPTTERKGDYGILVTFGISILLRNLALIIYGPYPLRPPSFWNGVLILGNLAITWDRVFAGVAGIALLLGLVLFMNRTPWGEALNAVSQSRESAAIVGINDQRFYMLAFALGGALAGGAGALVGPIYSLSPSMGLIPDTQAFAIVILGGMGSVGGSILAGLLIGVSESMFVAFFPDPSRSLTYAQAFSLVVLMIVLLVRPTGFFGRASTAMDQTVRTLQLAGGVALLALALSFPLLVNAYWLSVGILAIFYAIVTASWVLLAGYAGQFSFGHMAFVSIGAYASGLLVNWFAIPIPLGMLGGVVLCALIGSGIGFVVLRMRGPYLALFTMAFSEVVRIVLVSETEVTGGSGGLQVQPLFHTRSDAPYWYLGWALLAASLGLMGWLVTSRWGLFFRAIRENESAAAAAGVKVLRFRILAFAIASSFAGLAGGFFGHYVGILTPDIGSVDQMGLIVAMAVIGGAESLVAATIGALGLEFLVEALRSYGQWRLVLFGALLLLTMRFARNGLLALCWEQVRRLDFRARDRGARAREVG